MSIKVVSLFSGGGGLDLGFQKAGYEIIWAIDNNKNAVATYKENIGNHIICADINKIDLAMIPNADVVIGGPPCQSFSLAGKRNVEDERGQLVWRYIEIIRHVKPKAFVFENVMGLLSAKNKNGEKIFELLKRAFCDIGYNIESMVVNAADYGIPQRRKRVLIVGVNNGKEFAFPSPTHNESGTGLKKYVSVKEAQHFMPKMSELDKYIVSHVRPGGNYMDIPPDVKSERIRRLQREGGHTTCYGRMSPDEPSYTINTYFNRPNVGCNIHYAENRLITVREALRLQSFPDSYKIVSSSKQGRNLIVGNAVPPLMAEIIANQLKKHLKEEENND